MAKQKSILKIEGTLDELTFYKGQDGFMVRTKGGVSKNRIMNDPAFARTRENGMEFGHCAKMSKLLRLSILDLLQDAKDNRLHSRLMQRLAEVKNCDLTSARGNRTVANGLSTSEGKEALKGFNFNRNATLGQVLLKDFELDMTTGEISLLDFHIQQHVQVAEGATHVALRSGFLNLDFDTFEKELMLSTVVNLMVDAPMDDVVLLPSGVPTGSGQMLYFLKVSFYQEVNGAQYPLRNGIFNALEMVAVG